jgi:hypothetical protein
MTISNNHIFPESISNEVNKALSYYPDLKKVKIEIQFKKQIKKSTMMAQPNFSSFLKNRKHRKYYIFISNTFKISDKMFKTKDLPSNVLIGWIGHELGHIVDYQTKNNLNLIIFGIRYLFSKNHIKEAERMADTYAVNRGMREYILETKNFILNHAEIDDSYKLRIKKYYLSPEEIMDIVSENNTTS